MEEANKIVNHVLEEESSFAKIVTATMLNSVAYSMKMQAFLKLGTQHVIDAMLKEQRSFEMYIEEGDWANVKILIQSILSTFESNPLYKRLKFLRSIVNLATSNNELESTMVDLTIHLFNNVDICDEVQQALNEDMFIL